MPLEYGKTPVTIETSNAAKADDQVRRAIRMGCATLIAEIFRARDGVVVGQTAWEEILRACQKYNSTLGVRKSLTAGKLLINTLLDSSKSTDANRFLQISSNSRIPRVIGFHQVAKGTFINLLLVVDRLTESHSDSNNGAIKSTPGVFSRIPSLQCLRH